VSALGVLERESSSQLLDKFFKPYCVDRLDGILTRPAVSGQALVIMTNTAVWKKIFSSCIVTLQINIFAHSLGIICPIFFTRLF
jgi:hypothetical protein